MSHTTRAGSLSLPALVALGCDDVLMLYLIIMWACKPRATTLGRHPVFWISDLCATQPHSRTVHVQLSRSTAVATCNKTKEEQQAIIQRRDRNYPSTCCTAPPHLADKQITASIDYSLGHLLCRSRSVLVHCISPIHQNFAIPLHISRSPTYHLTTCHSSAETRRHQ